MPSLWLTNTDRYHPRDRRKQHQYQRHADRYQDPRSLVSPRQRTEESRGGRPAPAGRPRSCQACAISPAETYELRPIGAVSSPLTDPTAAPLQGDEGGPDAWLVIDDAYAEALTELEPGAEIIVLTWLHEADRDTLSVHPRSDPNNPIRGVFTTRSQDRPNPIGLHRVRVLAIDGTRVRVSDLEAIDGTPIVDVKVALGSVKDR